MDDTSLQKSLGIQMQARTERLHQEIACNLAAIQRLYAFDRGEVTLKSLGYTHRKAHRRTDEDRQRMYKSIAQLRLQNALMQHEITVLQQMSHVLGLTQPEQATCQ